MAAPPTRLDEDLYASAKAVAEVMSRSTAQQLSHWARLGREVEASGLTVSVARQVLAGRASYDEVSPTAQAMVRATWDEQFAQSVAELDLSSEFAAEGRSWVELDEDGNVVRRHADGRVERVG